MKGLRTVFFFLLALTAWLGLLDVSASASSVLPSFPTMAYSGYETFINFQKNGEKWPEKARIVFSPVNNGYVYPINPATNAICIDLGSGDQVATFQLLLTKDDTPITGNFEFMTPYQLVLTFDVNSSHLSCTIKHTLFNMIQFRDSQFKADFYIGDKDTDKTSVKVTEIKKAPTTTFTFFSLCTTESTSQGCIDYNYKDELDADHMESLTLVPMMVKLSLSTDSFIAGNKIILHYPKSERAYNEVQNVDIVQENILPDLDSSIKLNVGSCSDHLADSTSDDQCIIITAIEDIIPTANTLITIKFPLTPKEKSEKGEIAVFLYNGSEILTLSVVNFPATTLYPVINVQFFRMRNTTWTTKGLAHNATTEADNLVGDPIDITKGEGLYANSANYVRIQVENRGLKANDTLDLQMPDEWFFVNITYPVQCWNYNERNKLLLDVSNSGTAMGVKVTALVDLDIDTKTNKTEAECHIPLYPLSRTDSPLTTYQGKVAPTISDTPHFSQVSYDLPHFLGIRAAVSVKNNEYITNLATLTTFDFFQTKISVGDVFPIFVSSEVKLTRDNIVCKYTYSDKKTRDVSVSVNTNYDVTISKSLLLFIWGEDVIDDDGYFTFDGHLVCEIDIRFEKYTNSLTFKENPQILNLPPGFSSPLVNNFKRYDVVHEPFVVRDPVHSVSISNDWATHVPYVFEASSWSFSFTEAIFNPETSYVIQSIYSLYIESNGQYDDKVCKSQNGTTIANVQVRQRSLTFKFKETYHTLDSIITCSVKIAATTILPETSNSKFYFTQLTNRGSIAGNAIGNSRSVRIAPVFSIESKLETVSAGNSITIRIHKTTPINSLGLGDKYYITTPYTIALANSQFAYATEVICQEEGTSVEAGRISAEFSVTTTSTVPNSFVLTLTRSYATNPGTGSLACTFFAIPVDAANDNGVAYLSFKSVSDTSDSAPLTRLEGSTKWPKISLVYPEYSFSNIYQKGALTFGFQFIKAGSTITFTLPIDIKIDDLDSDNKVQCKLQVENLDNHIADVVVNGKEYTFTIISDIDSTLMGCTINGYPTSTSTTTKTVDIVVKKPSSPDTITIPTTFPIVSNIPTYYSEIDTVTVDREESLYFYILHGSELVSGDKFQVTPQYAYTSPSSTVPTPCYDDDKNAVANITIKNQDITISATTTISPTQYIKCNATATPTNSTEAQFDLRAPVTFIKNNGESKSKLFEVFFPALRKDKYATDVIKVTKLGGSTENKLEFNNELWFSVAINGTNVRAGNVIFIDYFYDGLVMKNIWQKSKSDVIPKPSGYNISPLKTSFDLFCIANNQIAAYAFTHPATATSHFNLFIEFARDYMMKPDGTTVNCRIPFKMLYSSNRVSKQPVLYNPPSAINMYYFKKPSYFNLYNSTKLDGVNVNLPPFQPNVASQKPVAIITYYPNQPTPSVNQVHFISFMSLNTKIERCGDNNDLETCDYVTFELPIYANVVTNRCFPSRNNISDHVGVMISNDEQNVYPTRKFKMYLTPFETTHDIFCMIPVSFPYTSPQLGNGTAIKIDDETYIGNIKFFVRSPELVPKEGQSVIILYNGVKSRHDIRVTSDDTGNPGDTITYQFSISANPIGSDFWVTFKTTNARLTEFIGCSGAALHPNYNYDTEVLKFFVASASSDETIAKCSFINTAFKSDKAPVIAILHNTNMTYLTNGTLDTVPVSIIGASAIQHNELSFFNSAFLTDAQLVSIRTVVAKQVNVPVNQIIAVKQTFIRTDVAPLVQITLASPHNNFKNADPNDIASAISSLIGRKAISNNIQQQELAAECISDPTLCGGNCISCNDGNPCTTDLDCNLGSCNRDPVLGGKGICGPFVAEKNSVNNYSLLSVAVMLIVVMVTLL